MALNQSQWYEKLKSFVPEWWFEQDNYNQAVFQGLAAVLAELQLRGEEHQQITYLDGATEQFLDAHGDERNVIRLIPEPDNVYRERIRNIVNNSDCPAIKGLVDPILINGEATIIEHFKDRVFFGREAYYSRKQLFLDAFYNLFTIIVDNQTHAPYSFLSREQFAVREDFFGTGESELSLFEQIVAIVNKAKAFGVMYQVLERSA
jgi:hypothetical protein